MSHIILIFFYCCCYLSSPEVVLISPWVGNRRNSKQNPNVWASSWVQTGVFCFEKAHGSWGLEDPLCYILHVVIFSLAVSYWAIRKTLDQSFLPLWYRPHQKCQSWINWLTLKTAVFSQQWTFNKLTWMCRMSTIQFEIDWTTYFLF